MLYTGRPLLTLASLSQPAGAGVTAASDEGRPHSETLTSDTQRTWVTYITLS